MPQTTGARRPPSGLRECGRLPARPPSPVPAAAGGRRALLSAKVKQSCAPAPVAAPHSPPASMRTRGPPQAAGASAPRAAGLHSAPAPPAPAPPRPRPPPPPPPPAEAISCFPSHGGRRGRGRGGERAGVRRAAGVAGGPGNAEQPRTGAGAGEPGRRDWRRVRGRRAVAGGVQDGLRPERRRGWGCVCPRPRGAVRRWRRRPRPLALPLAARPGGLIVRGP